MSVRKRGDFWHYDFTLPGSSRRYRGSTKQRSKTAALKAEARERERALDELGSAPRRTPTLKAASDAWFAARVKGKRSELDVARRLRTVVRLVGPDVLVSDIDAPEIEGAIQARRLETTRHGKAVSDSTVNRDLVDTTLRPLLRYCRRILKVPVADIDWSDLRLDENKGRSRSFSARELLAWRAALPLHHRPIFDFLATYGVRLREAFFPLDSFDPGSGIIVLRKRKNGLPHTVRLQPMEARDMAARAGRAREASLDCVWFRDTKAGLVAVAPRAFQSASYKALRAAGIADARAVHDLRHHAATAFLRLPGASLKHVQQFLGHESIASTARYAHVSTDDVFNIMRHASDTKSAADPETSIDSKTLTGT